MQTAQSYHPHAHKAAIDRLSLTYDARFVRRKVLTMVSGARLLVDLPHTTSLDQGGVLITGQGNEIAIEAAAEPLLRITADNLTRLAWHIGNRHTPCEIQDTCLIIQRNHVLEDMLGQLGATVTHINAAFTPEGGAYGHGRTHGHQH